MNSEKKHISEFERNNKVGMRSHFIVVILMELLAVLQFLAGESSVVLLLAYLVVGLFSPIAELVCWKKNHETKMIKHFVGYGYAVYFTLTIFTSSDGMVFYFVVPLLLVIAIYNDVPYTIKINAGVILESLVITILGGKTDGYGYTSLNNAIVQNIVIVLIAIFSIWVARTINLNSKDKLDRIQDMMDQTDSGISSISRDLKTLQESTENVRTAMEQVSDGTNNTAEAVEKQMLQTEEIGEKTTLVENTTGEIRTSMQVTMECVAQGKEDLQQLLDQVDGTVSSGENMAKLLTELQTNMAEMGKISKMIDSIAFQTNILALNANVEAARAGEAGKGFAVVADEVSSMSNKTKEATEQISQMIANISASLQDVTDGILGITEEIHGEKDSAAKSQESFAAIESNAVAVNESIASLAETLGELTDANHGIMDSIQTISAVSEQVSALAAEARTQEEQNASVLDHIAGEAQKLAQAQ